MILKTIKQKLKYIYNLPISRINFNYQLLINKYLFLNIPIIFYHDLFTDSIIHFINNFH